MTVRIDVLAPDEEASADDLTRVINSAYAVGEEGLWEPGWVRTTPTEVAELTRRGGMLTARVDGEIVGCGCIQALDAATTDLGFVSVLPEQWGGGAGRAIVDAAEDLARSRGATTMQLELLVPKEWVHPHKDRLRLWYSRLGYRTIRTARFEEVASHLESQLATPCEFLVFRKPLDGGSELHP
jgi:GNAT superfamily N-acetyltransferase